MWTEINLTLKRSKKKMKKKICNYIVIFYKCKDSVCSVKKKKTQ